MRDCAKCKLLDHYGNFNALLLLILGGYRRTQQYNNSAGNLAEKRIDMASKKYKAGDQVQLISGGPVMTVKKVVDFEDDTYWCQWFVGSKLHTGQFTTDSLQAPVEKAK
jgi:uncharacterized protein YodC (DUF2158 family)